MRKLLSYVRRAVDDFSLIDDGDKIAVGVSGGKDSLTLLCALAQMRRFYPKKYDVCAITIDMGFDGKPFQQEGIRSLCESLGVEYHVRKTDIAQIIFDIRKEKNPCSLCAKMRRGALDDEAKALGCNKVALGHSCDDAIETFFLSLIFEGRMSCFKPETYLSRKDITVIRPMVYMWEHQVVAFSERQQLPVVKSGCPANGNTQRQKIKEFIQRQEKDFPGFKEHIFGAISNSKLDGWARE